MNSFIKLTLLLICQKLLLVQAQQVSVLSAEYLNSAIRDLSENKQIDFIVPVSEHKHSDLYELLRMTTEAPVERSDNYDLLQHYQNNYEQNPVQNYQTNYNHQLQDQQNYQPQQSYDVNNNQNPVPSLSLTKGELLALYDSAVKNGNVLNTDTNTAIHEINNDNVPSTSHLDHTYDNKANGYYYYYYPLKALVDDINNSTNHYTQQYTKQYADYTKKQNTVHSHTHLHDVKIHAMPTYGAVLPPPKSKAIEPLFMAISSFMGMAMMFLFSMVFLPSFKNQKSRSGVKPEIPQATISDVVFEAIEGHDCRERIYCEAGKILNTLNLSDNRFVRFFQRMMPNRFSRSIDRIRQEAQKKRKCVLIQCKRKGNNNVNINNKNNTKPVKNNNSVDSSHLKMEPKLPQQKNKNQPMRQKINNRPKLKQT